MEHYIKTNQITVHCLDYPGDAPHTLVLLHGLSANAACFEGLISAGLSQLARVVSIDLRGRGKSDKPEGPYSMEAHAADVIAVIEALQLENIILGGHSFGALLSVYVAAQYPQYAQKVIIMDAAARLHENVQAMVAPATLRLRQPPYASFDAFRAHIRQAEYLDGIWNPDMEAYYVADVETLPDGRVQHRSSFEHIQLAIQGLLGSGIDWISLIQGVQQPALLIQADGVYALGAPILPEAYARETVAMLPDGRFVQVPGNHFTMLYETGARAIVAAIQTFLAEKK